MSSSSPPGPSRRPAGRRATGPQFDAVAMEIAATLNFLGVPPAEHTEFTDIIESDRAQMTAGRAEPVPA